jgi:hypothetical protein
MVLKVRIRSEDKNRVKPSQEDEWTLDNIPIHHVPGTGRHLNK